jgi:glutathione peroxidase
VNTHTFTATDIDGNLVPLSNYAGKVLLVVNVASKCGLTPQYEGLEALHREFAAYGLQVLGFPCNQFGGQEPGTETEIAQFCSTTYDVTFPLFAKVDVNGPDAVPLFRYLRAQAPGDLGPDTPGAGRLYQRLAETQPEVLASDEVKWNFTKFLVGRDGEVITRYEPTVTPAAIRADLPAVLEQAS